MTNLFSQLNNLPSLFWKICVLVLLALVILFGIQTCNKTLESHKLQNDLTNQIYNSKMAFTTSRQKDSSTIIIQQQLIANKDAEIVKHIEKEDGLKSVASQVVVRTVYQIQKVYVPFTDSPKVITKVDTIAGKLDTMDLLPVPSRVQKIDSNFQLDATVLKDGLEVNFLKIPNTTTVTIGETKGVFNHKSIVRVHQSNPYLMTEDMKNVIVDQGTTRKQWESVAIGGGIVLSLDAIFVAWYLVTRK